MIPGQAGARPLLPAGGHDLLAMQGRDGNVYPCTLFTGEPGQAGIWQGPREDSALWTIHELQGETRQHVQNGGLNYRVSSQPLNVRVFRIAR